MTPFYKAVILFLRNPVENSTKIIPYLRSYLHRYRRITAELIGIDLFSKPYSGHKDLLDVFDFENGFFVQCGGFDGVASDPTYYLEKFKKWTGIIIEPIPKMALACKKNRPRSTIYQTALVSHDYPSTEIELINCNSMSTTSSSQLNIAEWVKKGEEAQGIKSKKITVPAKTLDAVLKLHGVINKIDLLVIDVEGSETEVLKGFSLTEYKPDYLLLETGTEDLRKSVEEIICEEYNFIRKISFSDHLYKRKA